MTNTAPEQHCENHCEHDRRWVVEGVCRKLTGPYLDTNGECRHRCVSPPVQVERHEFVEPAPHMPIRGLCARPDCRQPCSALVHQVEHDPFADDPHKMVPCPIEHPVEIGVRITDFREEHHNARYTHFWIECGDCGLEMEGPRTYEDVTPLIVKWNTRRTPSPAPLREPEIEQPAQTLYEECEAAWLPYRDGPHFSHNRRNVFHEGYVAGRADQSKLYVERDPEPEMLGSGDEAFLRGLAESEYWRGRNEARDKAIEAIAALTEDREPSS